MRKSFARMIAFVGMLLLAPRVDAVSPSWDKTISKGRFKILAAFNGEAVIDKETGLVWEQSPSTDTFTWFIAHLRCNQTAIGGRLGWRLPGVQELASLVNKGHAPGTPALPAGHPFGNVQSSDYWSATTEASDANAAWTINLSVGGAFNSSFTKTGNSLHVWCVRGGEGVEAQ